MIFFMDKKLVKTPLFKNTERNGGLKRSYTVLHHGRSSTQNHKPPLPKLSSPNLGNLSSPVISTSQTSVNILAGISNNSNSMNSNSNSNNHANLMNSDTSSTGSNHSSVTSANSIRMDNNWSARQVIGPSRISPTGSSDRVHGGGSGSTPHIFNPTSSPRPNRPKELFVRQITLPMDSKLETPIVPSPSLVTPVTPSGGDKMGSSNNRHNSNNNQVQIPPPIPARRYAHRYNQLQHHSNYPIDNGERSGTSDSGILTSPSPPTDSGIAMSPPTPVKNNPSVVGVGGIKKTPQTDDTLSLCSSSSSSSGGSSCGASEASSGSRYDNVVRVAGGASSARHHNTQHSADSLKSKNSGDHKNRRFSNDSNSPSKTSTLVAAAAEIAAQRLSVSPTREISTQTMPGPGRTGSGQAQTGPTSNKTGPNGQACPEGPNGLNSQSEAECNCDGDDEADEETSDSSSDILVLDSSSSEVGGKIQNCEEDEIDIDDDLEDSLDEDENDDLELADQATKNHDEIEISDHFTRQRSSLRRNTGPRGTGKKFGNTKNEINRDSGPYDNFTLPGAVLNVPVNLQQQGQGEPFKTHSKQPKVLHHSSSVSSSVLSSSAASSPGINTNRVFQNRSPAISELQPDLEPASIKRLLAAGPTSNV